MTLPQKYASFQVLSARIAQPGDALLRTAHRHVFDYVPKVGFLYVRSRAISSRINDNFDGFPAEEIKSAYRTFIGKPVFVNHHNANHRRARGVIIDAALHEDTNPDGTPDTWAEVLMEVDAIRFPRLAEAVVRGDIARTSMGTDVQHSICTACGNRAETPADYCQHIPRMKGMRIERRTASGAKEAVLVAEQCYGLHFFENSLLVEAPADPTAYAYGVDASGLVGTEAAHLAKVAKTADVVTAPGWENLKPTGEVYEDVCGTCKAPVPFEWWSDGVFRSARPVEPGAGSNYLGTWCPLHASGRTSMKAEGSMCRECNPGLAEGLCSSHAHFAKMRRQFGLGASHWQSISPGGFGSTTDLTLFPTYASKVTTDDVIQAEAIEWKDLVRQLMPLDASTQCPECGSFFRYQGGKWVCPKGHDTRPSGTGDVTFERSAMKIGYGETKAPAQVDTLRVDKCPVCGDATAFNGDQCPVCGYIAPPDMFADPDLTKARENDMRGDQQANDALDPMAPAAGDTLECDNCGSEFDADGGSGQAPEEAAAVAPTTKSPTPDPRQPQADPNAAPAKAVDGGDPQLPTQEVPKPREKEEGEGGLPWDKKKDKAPDADEDESADDKAKEPGQNPFAKDKGEDADADKNPFAKDDGTESDDPSETHVDVRGEGDEVGTEDDKPENLRPDPTKPKHGDPCPDCGEGTVKSKSGQAPGFGDAAEPIKSEKPAEGDNPFAKGKDGDQPQADVDVKAEPGADVDVDVSAEKPPADDAKDEGDDKDSDDDESDEKKDKKKKPGPPWLNKGDSKSSSRRDSVDMNQPNPAQQSRNALIAAVKEQQSTISAQSRQIEALRQGLRAVAALVPGASNLRTVAVLKSAADEEKDEVATSDDAAVAPAVKDDPESQGAAPAPANTGVTPDATTDVNNSNVAAPAEPFNNLTDVTAPTSGTDSPPSGDAAHVKTDVVTTTPTSQVAFPSNEGGWTAAKGDPQERFTASLRLARLRIAVGNASGEDLTVAQAINGSDLTLAQIATEMDALGQVAQRGQQPRQAAQAQAQRGTVPQRAASAQRGVPSLSSAAAGGAPTTDGGDPHEVTSDEFNF